MKKLSLYLALLCSLTTFLSSCKSDKNCDKIYCVALQPPIIIELRDSQDRDLLDAATPGHFDTTAIKALNPDMLKVLPAGNQQFIGNKDRIRLALYIYSSGSTKIRLTNTVTDDIVTRFEKGEGCCSQPLLVSFTYNAVSYPPAFTQYFIVKK